MIVMLVDVVVLSEVRREDSKKQRHVGELRNKEVGGAACGNRTQY